MTRSRMRPASIVPLAAFAASLLAAGVAAAQQGQAPADERYPTRWAPRIASAPAVRDALRWLDGNFPAQVQEWVRITQIPAQSTHEQQRGAYVAEQMRAAGLEVSADSIGNVTGRRRGSGGGPTVVFATHMDTVHPMDTDVTVKVDGGILRAPGVFDNSASVADMLAVIRAMNQAGVRTRGDVVLVATVQEELGLVGMDWWLAHNPRPDMVVAVDGGLGPVSYGALGIYWTRYHLTGEGSHTNTSTGKPHPAHAMADAIRSIYELRVPENQGGAVYNVGMVGGGKVFNAIPQDVWFTVDLRSVNPALLDSLDAEITGRVQRAATENHVAWSREAVQHQRAAGTEEMLRDRRADPIVQTALDVHRFLGIPARAEATGSTDSNMAVTRGIPSISVGRARGGDQHTLSEWADRDSALPATRMLLLLAVSLAGMR
ncbi:M20/M25/M40 family metallo-hydrolase [Longimicrobium sp.]|uniref:M20/M25/M40 family metallo-hydrolase n=1 Tax=Longimicrobium sp. TaxID=2029185 RepID=UPI002C715EB9|nr:M20/M25/M40 family metallo-hydrolase [Longimicrobium sp.]HSU12620.1 M20/M25/M40 family metallo-hydrolase [Longimicrobium sp.]